MSGSSLRSPACLVAALLSVGCQEPSIDRISDLQVRDSARVTVVRNTQTDIPLDWSFERLWTLGGAQDGPEAFFRVDGDALATDGKSVSTFSIAAITGSTSSRAGQRICAASAARGTVR